MRQFSPFATATATIAIVPVLGLSATIGAVDINQYDEEVAPYIQYFTENRYPLTVSDMVQQYQRAEEPLFNARHEALNLFGEMRVSTPEENMAYKAMKSRHATTTGINIFNL